MYGSLISLAAIVIYLFHFEKYVRDVTVIFLHLFFAQSWLVASFVTTILHV